MHRQGGSDWAGCLFTFSPPSYQPAVLQQRFEPKENTKWGWEEEYSVAAGRRETVGDY